MALAPAFASCSDDDNKFEPGPAPAADCPSVFFVAPSATKYTFTAEDIPEVTVDTKRGNTEKEISMPLEVVADLPEGDGQFIVPSTVDFAAGEAETSFKIDCSKLPTKTECTLTLKVPEAYSNPYSAGLDAVTFNVTVSGTWELYAKDAKFAFQSKFGDVYSDIYAIQGTNRFKIVNFLDSGLDLQFEVSDTSYSHIIPLNNFISYNDAFGTDDDAYNCWLLYDSANESYPVWSPGNTGTDIEYAIVYGWGGGVDYTYINFNKGNGCITLQTCIGGNWSYIYVYFYFESLFKM